MAREPQPEVFQCEAELFEALESEIGALQSEAPPQLICLATGATFSDFYESISADTELLAAPLVCTNLDEYEGFQIEQHGGMAWELSESLPALGRFLPFPSHARSLLQHAERIASLGGVALQFLGIGRNGHLAFNEPGTGRDAHFNAVELHPWSSASLRSPHQPAR